MAGSVNKVTILGNLGQDPEVRTFPSGGKICNMSVATTDTWRDRETGERREKTEWHRVTIKAEPLVKIAEQYLRKGSKVYLEGRLETRKWQDQSGQDRYTTEVVLPPFKGELTLLGGRGDSPGGEYAGGHDDRGGYSDDRGSSQGGGNTDSASAASAPTAGEIDDDIPF